MAKQSDAPSEMLEMLAGLLNRQSAAAAGLLGLSGQQSGKDEAEGERGIDWAETIRRLQAKWIEFQDGALDDLAHHPSHFADPARWAATAQEVCRQLPLARPETQKQLWEEGLSLFETVLGQYGIGPRAEQNEPGDPVLPRADRRFADPAWRAKPVFALLHQTYLMLSEHILDMAEGLEGLDPARKQQLVFATRALIDALSPSNFPLTNPVVIDRAVESRGESLVRGMEHLLLDLRRGQLTHADPEAFRIGENIATTPGKVVHRTPLFELIQYAPATEKVMTTPLVIFPPWINRFYILDLNEKKSFVRWLTEQGVTVFMVSWKSADETMGEVVWEDYIAAQIEAVDVVRERLAVPSVNVIGYCVAGTTLAATLAVLARRGEAEKIRSATFFTAQVDFEEAGELRNFIDDQQIEAVSRLGQGGYVDGRHLAATFNLLRGNELIWNYVVNNYLKGEDYPAFDLLHWNSDYTNLPARWHVNYLRDLYRDNRLVVPDSLSALGTRIDLRRVETPAYIQAGREDHIAPAQSVWKMTRHIAGPTTFVLAGSGHIAGVVNPPASGKYQFWTNARPVETFEEFTDGATEHPGSWWPHWFEWLQRQDHSLVAALGRRKPGMDDDRVLGDAPGTYVRIR